MATTAREREESDFGLGKKVRQSGSVGTRMGEGETEGEGGGCCITAEDAFLGCLTYACRGALRTSSRSGTHVIVRADWGDVGAGVLGLAVRSAVDLLFVLLKMRRMPK